MACFCELSNIKCQFSAQKPFLAIFQKNHQFCGIGSFFTRTHLEGINFSVVIIVVSVTLVVVLIVLFALYLHREKQREGITYEKAIAIINDYIKEHYGEKRGAKRKFCDDFEINYRTLTRAINPENYIETPNLVADTLNRIGYDVKLMNKTMYLKKD